MEFYTKETRKERDRKDKVSHILVQFAVNLSERVSGNQSSLNLNLKKIFFLFY